MKFSGQIHSGNAVAWICVATPNGRQHVQAVPAGEFLIGRGPLCHLRLGDSSIPERLVSMTVESHAAHFLCLASSPAVYLNGEPTLEGILRDGDVLELGAYGLIFRTVWENAQLVSNEQPVLETRNASARELVDLISEELDVVTELEHTREKGLQELLAAARASEARIKPLNVQRSDSGLQPILEAIERNQLILQVQHDQIVEMLSALSRQQEVLLEAVHAPRAGILQMPDRDDSPVLRRASA